MTHRVGDFLAWLGGGNKDVLGLVPQERARFVQMAGVLLTTASIAMASMIFALHDGVKAPLAAAIFLGMCWGFIILNLDRFLVLSMGSTRDKRTLILITIPRLLLAIVISLVISTPLTLRIFASDIQAQLSKTQLSESKALKSQLAATEPQQEASQAEKKIQAYQKILDGHLPESVSNPQLTTATNLVNKLLPEVASAKHAEIKAQERWQCEIYGSGPGCAGASNRPGNGPIAHAKHREYLQAVAAYNSLKSQLRKAQASENAAQGKLKTAQASALSRYQAQARKQLPGLQAEYNKLEASIQKTKNNSQNAVNNNTGLLAQLSALRTAGAHNPTLLFAQLVVMALFFLIELLPVGVKFLLNLQPPTTYEVVAKLEEDKILDRARVDRITHRTDAERESDEHRKIAVAQSNKRVNVAEDMQKREQDLGIEANEYVAGKMKEVLELALQQWSDQVRARLSTGHSSNGSAPNGKAGGPASGGGPPPLHVQRQLSPGVGLPPDEDKL